MNVMHTQQKKHWETGEKSYVLAVRGAVEREGKRRSKTTNLKTKTPQRGEESNSWKSRTE